MQKHKTDTHTYTHTRRQSHQFVSEIGVAEEDDIHTQTGMIVMDIQLYLRQGKANYYRLSSPTTPPWKIHQNRLQDMHIHFHSG